MDKPKIGEIWQFTWTSEFSYGMQETFMVISLNHRRNDIVEGECENIKTGEVVNYQFAGNGMLGYWTRLSPL